jgi:hypothetical protein
MADQFDATSEYKALLDMVRKKDGNGTEGATDTYQYLMSREKRVLDTVDRVVNDSWRKDAETRTFLQLPLHEIGGRILSTLNAILEDLVAARNATSVYKALVHGERKIYTGIFLLTMALVALFADATS